MFKYKCIPIKTMTYAQKAVKILAQKGVTAYNQKQTADDRLGCGRCLKINARDLSYAMSVLENNRIPVSGEPYDVQ